MGQYFKPVLVRDDKTIIAWAYSHEYDNGLKLMEHSWVGNGFVAVIENLLLKNPTRVVWCGDYADGDPDLGVDEDGDAFNLYQLCRHKGNAFKEVKGGNTKISKRAKYVINHTTKQFIDKTKVPVTDTWVNPDNPKDTWDYRVHPLPLMTCNSNGRGGGDYRGEDPQELIGSWAGHEISIDTRKPRGYKELIFDLVE